MSGLAKAQYAVGYFTESGIGCRRDPLEANVWYVKAADQGETRAIQRIAAIRAAADGINPAQAAADGSGRKNRKSGTLPFINCLNMAYDDQTAKKDLAFSRPLPCTPSTKTGRPRLTSAMINT
jgi:TPR repeat protein